MTTEKRKRLPINCPSCGSTLRVRTMHCTECDTTVEGDYQLPALMRLRDEDQLFIHDFVMCSGSLKEMASRMGLSYPTVRNRLDEVIAALQQLASEKE